jgi:hypothetical protein
MLQSANSYFLSRDHPYAAGWAQMYVFFYAIRYLKISVVSRLNVVPALHFPHEARYSSVTPRWIHGTF